MSKITCVRKRFDPAKTYEEFIAERLEGFGASDIADLFNIEPYGCRRRLFLERLGLLPRDKEELRFHLERGKFFEAPVADLYQDRTKRTVKPIGTGYIRECPYMRANADRMVIGIPELPGREPISLPGVLEIKVPGAWSFKKIKKEGLPEAYILQIQWQMFCYGCTWGSFAVYWPDGHELLHFDIERDDAIIEKIFALVQAEWRTLSNLKAMGSRKEQEELFLRALTLSSHSQACQKCPAFEDCHHREFIPAEVQDAPELEPLAARYAELSVQIKGLETEKDALKENFREELVRLGTDKLRAGNYSVSVRQQTRTSLDAKEVEKSLPAEVFQACHKHVSYDVLTVKGSRK